MNPYDQASELDEENRDLKRTIEGLEEEIRLLEKMFTDLKVAALNATSSLNVLNEVPLMYLEDSIETIQDNLMGVVDQFD